MKPAVRQLLMGGRAYSPLVYNSKALRAWKARLALGRTQNINVGCFGDSLMAGVGATGGANTDDTAETFGLVGNLRSRINGYLGTKGGGYINVAETRVSLSVGGTNLSGFGPIYNSTYTTSRNMNASGQTQSYALPAGTAYDILVWEDTTAAAGRPTDQFSYATDGGGAVTVSGLGGSSVQRIITGPSGLADSAHTALLSWVAGQTIIHGVHWKYATGVSFIRMAGGGYTSTDLLATSMTGVQQDRIKRATYQAIPFDLAIIICGQNDCTQQVAKSTTPDVFKTSLQSVITQINGNPSAPPILLISGPDPNLSAPSTFDYPDYWPKLKELANENSNVAAIIWAEAQYDYTYGNARGWYSDQVHQTNSGYSTMADFLASQLTR